MYLRVLYTYVYFRTFVLSKVRKYFRTCTFENSSVHVLYVYSTGNMYEGTKIDLRVFVVYNVRVHVLYSTFESTKVLSKVLSYFRK